MGAGSLGNCVRFLPPLNISDADMDVAMGIFAAAAKVAFA
jgi:4-aminobutyrate aminotransferase-like enzyme